MEARIKAIFGGFKIGEVLVSRETGDEAVVVKVAPARTPLQEFAEDVLIDEVEIDILHKELRQIAQMVHQAYHGASGPDVDTGTWETCTRGVCDRVRRTLDPARVVGRRP